jgi:hypothetical protein
MGIPAPLSGKVREWILLNGDETAGGFASMRLNPYSKAIEVASVL